MNRWGAALIVPVPTVRTDTSKQGMGVNDLQLLLLGVARETVSNQIAVIPGIAFRCPEFLLLLDGSEVWTSLGAAARGVDGTNQIWLVGVEQAAIAFRNFHLGEDALNSSDIAQLALRSLLVLIFTWTHGLDSGGSLDQ